MSITSLKELIQLASKNRKHIIIQRSPQLGCLPAYLDLAQRHFEKSPPPSIKHLGTGQGSLVTFQAPVDLLRLVMPIEMADEVESLELIYRRS